MSRLLRALLALTALVSFIGTSVANGSISVQPPPAGAPFSLQLGGAFPPAPAVRIIERDRSDRPLAGRYNVCYVNAFQAQTGELGWWRLHHPELLLRRRGHPVVDRTWDEQLLDTSNARRRGILAAVVGRWFAGCARAGYQAVEPDNLDSWTRSEGGLSADGNLAYARLLIARAHALGLAIAQKNTPELARAGRRFGFDFAVAEECQAYSECDLYQRAYGDEVIEIEYTDNGGTAGFLAACHARGARISVILRDRNVAPAGSAGALERRCP